MEKDRINDLLLKSKEVYENGGDREDIYDVLLNTTFEMIPFSKYVPVRDDERRKELAKKLGISLDEFKKRRNKACRKLYSDDFLGGFSGGELTRKIENKLYVEKDNLHNINDAGFISKKSGCSRLFKYNSQFMKLDLKNYSSNPNCIKLYFNIKTEKEALVDYFCDLIDFVKDEEVEVYSKSRYEDSSDMVTFRFSNIEKFDKVIEFINKHKVNNENYNPLIPTYNGIGYTIDNGESYNSFLSKLIYDYVSSKEEVNIDSFRKYVNSRKQEDVPSDIDDKNKRTNTLFYINLNSVLNEEKFDIGRFIDDFNMVNKDNETGKQLIKK